ncbi:MAG TPA: fibronectin type III domain-containing protein [Candidatus Paceibacterota bacterium]
MKNDFLILGVIILASAGFVYADVSGSLLPESDGSYTQWTPKGSSTHYSKVDESVCNGDSDYVYTNSIASRDSYQLNLTSIPDGAVITQIGVTPCASRNKTGSGTSVMDLFYRWNQVNSADAGNYNPTGTVPTVMSEHNFSGLNLVKGSASSLQVGAVLSSGNKGARLSQITARVTYIPLTAPSNLTAQAVSGTSTASVLLTWIDNSSTEFGFEIERSTDGVNFVLVSTASANSTSINDNVPSSGTYWYRVRAYNMGGKSGYTNIASVVVP